MPGFSWKKVKELGISETEKDRFCAIFLTNIDQFKPTAAQLNAAADEFGASQNGFRVMYANSVKKYKDHGLYLGEEGAAAPTNAEGETETTAAAPAPKQKTPRKRKVPVPEGEGDGTPKKKSRPSKKAKEEAEAAAKAAADAAKEEVKEEGVEENAEGGEVKTEAEIEA